MVGMVEKDDVVVVRIKTFGGRVDGAVRIRDALLSSPAPVVVFIDSRAISAGASDLVCWRHNFDGTRCLDWGGDADPRGGPNQAPQPTSEKVVSYMRAEMRATAEANGRRGDIAEAMVDATIEVPGISDKDKLLTLTSKEALQHRVSDATVDNYDAALASMGLDGLVPERVVRKDGESSSLVFSLTLRFPHC